MTKPRVIVVGGGPAGLMAAGQAASLGAETLLLEKMDRPGRKLRITGKGRCNLTNVAALSRFFTSELIAFIEAIGVPTVTERGGRVFPVSGKAGDVVSALVQWVKDCGVIIKTRSPVKRLHVEKGRVAGVSSPAGVLPILIPGPPGTGMDWPNRPGTALCLSGPRWFPWKQPAMLPLDCRT